MSKILVIPDVHGRSFWKTPCKDISKYDKVVFLGDYVDPYNHEGINTPTAIQGLKDIIEFTKNNREKVILLLGNHDMPYFDLDYKNLSFYHSRYSSQYHNEIEDVFRADKDLFQIAYSFDDILFTHAGCNWIWIDLNFGGDMHARYKIENISDFAVTLNGLLESKEGLKKLFRIGEERGGRDKAASCIWCDVSEMHWTFDALDNPDFHKRDIFNFKQVFGHTGQMFYSIKTPGEIEFGNYIEIKYPHTDETRCYMLDNAKAYELDTETFTVQALS